MAALAIALSLSTIGPATSSFFAYSSFHSPAMRGGTSVAYQSQAVPDWLADIWANQRRQSAMASDIPPSSAEAPI
jgi:hypothetical protein